MTQLNNSIVHLTLRRGAQTLSIGTGFLYCQDGKFYIVTAWHCVSGRHPDTMGCVDPDAALPDNMIVNVAVSRGEFGANRLDIIIPLVDSERSLYLIHPQGWPRVDVAAIPFDPDAHHPVEWRAGDGAKLEGVFCLTDTGQTGLPAEICPIQTYLAPKHVVQKWFQAVDVTDELFIPGYPKNVSDTLNQPVWKRATVASSVQVGLDGQSKFLIDSASRSGMSGAPVLYYSNSGVIKIHASSFHIGRVAAIFVGVYVGRIGGAPETDAQIGTVWHARVVQEIIAAQKYERLPNDLPVYGGEIRAAVVSYLGKMSREGVALALNPDAYTRHYVAFRILDELEGRAGKSEVLEIVVEEASKYTGPYVEDTAGSAEV